MSEGLMIERPFPARTKKRAGRLRTTGQHHPETQSAGTVPRISRLMALAIHFEELLRTGAVHDQAELARLGQVSRARITQIMNLLSLAPDIQEMLLALSQPADGKHSIYLRQLQLITAIENWHVQRQQWATLAPSFG